MNQAMVYMIVDKGALRTGDCILDGLKLLSKVDAGASFLNHADHAAQMPGSSIEPFDDRRMTGVFVVGHIFLSHG